MAGKKKYPKVKCQVLRWWSHGGSMVAPNYPHCPRPSGQGQRDVPKWEVGDLNETRPSRWSHITQSWKAKWGWWWWVVASFIQAGESKGPSRTKSWGGTSAVSRHNSTKRQNTAKSANLVFFAARSKGRGASFISACLPLNEIHASPF